RTTNRPEEPARDIEHSLAGASDVPDRPAGQSGESVIIRQATPNAQGVRYEPSLYNPGVTRARPLPRARMFENPRGAPHETRSDDDSAAGPTDRSHGSDPQASDAL